MELKLKNSELNILATLLLIAPLMELKCYYRSNN